MESRNSYGYGYIGSNKKGFEWLLIYGKKYHQRMRSGYVYKTEAEAMEEGQKFLAGSDYYKQFDCKISAVKAESLHFAY